MKRLITLPAMALAALIASNSLAQTEYVTVDLEIDINKSAEEVWAKVGAFCDISDWMGLPCELTSGSGEIGSVRSLLNGRITEVLIGKTELSYGYTMPAVDGQFYNLYHGFMEAKSVTANTSKMLYTLVFDASNMENEEAVAADMARRRTQFEGMLVNMKNIAEAR